MGSNCWMDGRLVGKSVENILRCEWSTRFMQIILRISHWSESVLLMQGWRQCPSVHSLVDSTSIHKLVQRLESIAVSMFQA
jgi:hypothetical protein